MWRRSRRMRPESATASPSTKRWRFYRGDIEMPYPKTGETYDYTKAGAANGPAGVKYDDSGWRVLDLPHDFVVEEPFDENANGDQGYHPKGVGWYRKSFTLPESDRGRYIELQLDGMATLATVWFNGNVVRHNWSGYDSAYIDLTPFAHFGDEPNVVAVRVDSSALQGWWYEGGGIYRHTWLVKRSPVHIITDGVYAHPRKQPDGGWLVPVEATLRNIGEKPAQAEVRSILFDPAGRPVAQGPDDGGRRRRSSRRSRPSRLRVAAPQLWSVEEPHLYEVQTSVLVDGNQVDRLSTTAGFRTIRFDPTEGFFLNEKHVEDPGHLQSPGPCRRRNRASRLDHRVPSQEAEGARLQRASNVAQCADSRAARCRRPPRADGDGREPAVQPQPRLCGDAQMDGAPRPQPSEHHPLVGVQRRAAAGHARGL